MERISYQRKNYGWKYKFQGSLKTKVTYITPGKKETFQTSQSVATGLF